VLRVIEICLKKKKINLISHSIFDSNYVSAVFLLQHVYSKLNWSCNLDSSDGQESCESAAQVAAAVTDESMDVTDDFSHKELEQMFKEYIVIMEV